MYIPECLFESRAHRTDIIQLAAGHSVNPNPHATQLLRQPPLGTFCLFPFYLSMITHASWYSGRTSSPSITGGLHGLIISSGSLRVDPYSGTRNRCLSLCGCDFASGDFGVERHDAGQVKVMSVVGS